MRFDHLTGGISSGGAVLIRVAVSLHDLGEDDAAAERSTDRNPVWLESVDRSLEPARSRDAELDRESRRRFRGSPIDVERENQLGFPFDRD